MRNKNCGIISRNTTYKAHGANLKAIVITPSNIALLGSLDDSDGAFQNTAAATTLTFTGGPTGISATLSAPWGGLSNNFQVGFSDGKSRIVTLTNGATTATWAVPIVGSPTATATINAWANFLRACHDNLGCPLRASQQPCLPTSSNYQFWYFDEVLVAPVPITTDSVGGNKIEPIRQDALRPLGTRDAEKRLFGHCNISDTTDACHCFCHIRYTNRPGRLLKIAYGMNAASSATILCPWTTLKATTGFTINFSAAYTGTIDWAIVSF